MLRRVVTGGLVLSCAMRLIMGGVAYPWSHYAGDFFASFPPPYVQQTNPRLFAKSDPWDKGTRYGYGPGQYLAMHPFTYIDDPLVLARALLATYWILLGLVAWALYRRFWAPTDALGVVVFAVLWTHFVPLYDNLAQRNIELLEFALLAAALWLTSPSPDLATPSGKRTLAAGLVAGYAGLCKVKPMGIIAYFAARRLWLAAAASIVVFAGGLWVTDRVIGLNRFASLSHQGVGQGNGLDGLRWASLTTTTGLSEAIPRWLDPVPICSSHHPRFSHVDPQATMWWCLAIIAVFGAGIIVALVRSDRQRDAAGLQFSLVMAGLTVLNPHAHFYYALFLLVPISYLGGRLWRQWRAPGRHGLDWVTLVGGGAAWWLIGGGLVPMSVYSRLFRGCIGYAMMDAWVQMNLPTIGGLMLLGVLIRVGCRNPQPSHDPSVSPSLVRLSSFR